MTNARQQTKLIDYNQGIPRRRTTQYPIKFSKTKTKGAFGKQINKKKGIIIR